VAFNLVLLFLQAYRSADYDKPRSSRASDASVSTLNKL